MNRFPIFLLSIFICLAGCKQQPQQNRSRTETNSDPELQQLTAALNSAYSQMDMDEASGNIAKYWDRRLAVIDKKIIRKLDARQRREFAEAMGGWQFYRTKEAHFYAGFYEGGSIQPMVDNETYSEITEDRVEELESLWTSNLDMQADADLSDTNVDRSIDDSIMHVVGTDFHSRKIPRELEYYVALESTYETNHFYVGATELDGSNLVRALVYWKESRVLMDYGELADDAPAGAEIFAWQGSHLKLGQDTVDTPDDIDGSTYLETHRQWVDWMEECVYEGKIYVVTLREATNAFPNIRTTPDDE